MPIPLHASSSIIGEPYKVSPTTSGGAADGVSINASSNSNTVNITGNFTMSGSASTAISLDNAGITSNKNTVPFDNTSPFITSGLRFGTPACTSRGFKEKEFIIYYNYFSFKSILFHYSI